MVERGSFPPFRILGPVEVSGRDGLCDLGGAQRRAVVAQLVLAPGRVVSADALADGLWGDRPPPTATKSIQVHVSRLRKVLPSGTVVTRPPGYLLDVAATDTDAGRFEQDAAEGRSHEASGHLEQAAAALAGALALWRGPALGDVAEHPFAQAAAARLDQARTQAVEARLGLDLALGRHASVVAELDALTREHPLRERLWAHLMTALYRCDRQADALAAFTRARHHLVGELGLEPGPELRSLERAVLDQAVEPPATVRIEVQAAPPGGARRAARPGSKHDSGRPDRRPPPMMGRQRDLDRLQGAARMSQERGGLEAVAVRGEEGMGKTALLGAFVDALGPGVRAVSGRCRQHAPVPYGPWARIVRQLGSPAASDLIEGASGDHDTPERHRARLFDEVAAAVRVVAFEEPLILVLDDLHWSDEATVDLLLHVLDEVDDAAVLVVLAWRGEETDRVHPVSRLLHQLTRARAEIIDLSPLNVDEVATLVATADPGSSEAERARQAVRIHELTGGVPLFATDVVSTLGRAAGAAADTSADAPADRRDLGGPAIPPTLHASVARRVLQAGPIAQRVADLCAVLEEPLSPEVLGRLAPELEAEALLAGLDRLVDVGLLQETAEGHTFAHGAYRTSLVDGMRSGRRRTLHADAYRVLLEAAAAPALLVHHGDAAGPLVASSEVLVHRRDAGDDAVRRGAFADGHAHFARLAEQVPLADRAAALAAAADALGRAGEVGSMRRTAFASLDAARRHGASDDVVVKAVSLVCIFGDGFALDPEALRTADEAADVVQTSDARAELATAAAYHHAMWGSPRSTTEGALERAEGLLDGPGRPELRGGLLFARGLALLGSPELERRFALAKELLTFDHSTFDHRGRALRLQCLTEMSAGRLDQLEATLDQLLVVAGEAGSWLYRSDAQRWRIAACIAGGDADEARRAIDELEETSSGPLAGRAFVGTQRMVLDWFTGRHEACLAYLDAMLGVLPTAAPTASDRRLVDLVRMSALFDGGDLDAVGRRWDELDPLADLERPACRRYPAELALCAEVATGLGLVEDAPELAARLEPFRGQSIVLSWGEALLGTADGYLAGITSLLAGRPDEAAFADALAAEEQRGDRMSAMRLARRRDRSRAALGPEGSG